MKFRFPSANHFGIALIIAVVLALVGRVVFPLLAIEMSTAELFALGTGCGAFLGVVIAGLRFEAGSAAGTSSSEIKSIFVGNLAYKASREELQQLFSQYGTVRSVRIMTDRMTRRPRGFGFVEMDANGAAAAISALDGRDFNGRPLKVNEGNERRPRQDG